MLNEKKTMKENNIEVKATIEMSPEVVKRNGSE